MTQGPLSVRLTIDDHDPIAGSCAPPGTPPERFVGWLELMAIIERLGPRRSPEQDTGARA